MPIAITAIAIHATVVGAVVIVVVAIVTILRSLAVQAAVDCSTGKSPVTVVAKI